jgi:carbon storage regulator
MLVLSRKVGERIWIGDEIAVTVVRVAGGSVRIGIEAPQHLPVVREELKPGVEQHVASDPARPRAVARS